jgi:hypothetical protein
VNSTWIPCLTNSISPLLKDELTFFFALLFSFDYWMLIWKVQCVREEHEKKHHQIHLKRTKCNDADNRVQQWDSLRLFSYTEIWKRMKYWLRYEKSLEVHDLLVAVVVDNMKQQLIYFRGTNIMCIRLSDLYYIIALTFFVTSNPCQKGPHLKSL